jgi:hypothetical protein
MPCDFWLCPSSGAHSIPLEPGSVVKVSLCLPCPLVLNQSKPVFPIPNCFYFQASAPYKSDGIGGFYLSGNPDPPPVLCPLFQ